MVWVMVEAEKMIKVLEEILDHLTDDADDMSTMRAIYKLEALILALKDKLKKDKEVDGADGRLVVASKMSNVFDVLGLSMEDGSVVAKPREGAEK